MKEKLYDWPCQALHGGRGSGIYDNIDGRCQHPECHPSNDDRENKAVIEQADSANDENCERCGYPKDTHPRTTCWGKEPGV